MNNNNHVSRWFNVESVPQSHVFPQEDRPGNEQIPVCNTIPIIDLGNNNSRMITIDKIIKASQEYGFFQVHIYIYSLSLSLSNQSILDLLNQLID